MRTRLAAAVVAAIVAIPLTAATAGASPLSKGTPQHKCDASAGPIDEKCDDATK